MLLDELNRFVNQVISSKSNNRIQIFLNQTNHHIGYSIKQNDVTKLHLIHTAQKRYYEQPITHKPTASDERTSNYGLTEQHQVNFFSHQMNRHVCVNNHRPHRMEQANHAERELTNLMADKQITQHKQRHPIYKPKSNLQT